MSDSNRIMWRHLLPILIWLVVAALLVWWNARRTIYIGKMELSRTQVTAASILLVTILSLVLCWLRMGLRFVARRLGHDPSPSWIDHWALRYLLISLLALFLLLWLYGRYLEPRRVTVRTVPLGGHPPAGQQPVRIAVISDLHIEGDRRPWTDLDQVVNSTDPDLVLFLGDTLNRPRALRVLHRTLKGMTARHGKYAIFGNWETWYWHELPLLDETGFSWIHDQRRTVHIRGQTLHLVGQAYGDHLHKERAEELLAGCSEPGWRIFLYHTPDLVEAVPSADLYLAGHTHGGQLALPLYGALVTLSRYGKRFERGLYRVRRTHLYVNPGIGVEPMVPYRIGVQPEVTLLTLGAADRP